MSLKKNYQGETNRIMWSILKFDKKKLSLLQKDLKKKLGEDIKIYIPKFRIQKYKNNKLITKEINLLGDYLFCFHRNLKLKNTINSLKFSRGLKYFLTGFVESQNDIEKFVTKCKTSECKEGFLSINFFELDLKRDYKFSTGPFTDKIFQIINLQKNKINILIGNIKTTIKEKEFLFTPI